MDFKEIIAVAKRITLDDLLGAAALFIVLFGTLIITAS